MFVDRSFGATHQSLFLIQYSPGAKIDPHDHTFEESYFIVGGRVHAVADGKSYDLGPGDVIWTGVGCIHSFANNGANRSAGLRRKRRCRPPRKYSDSSAIGRNSRSHPRRKYQEKTMSTEAQPIQTAPRAPRRSPRRSFWKACAMGARSGSTASA
jgi:uncharacterized cupin superfamily protein